MKNAFFKSETLRKINLFMINKLVFGSLLLASLLVSLSIAAISASHGTIAFLILLTITFKMRRELRRTSLISVTRIV